MARPPLENLTLPNNSLEKPAPLLPPVGLGGAVNPALAEEDLVRKKDTEITKHKAMRKSMKDCFKE